jgi:hypothetical protein
MKVWGPILICSLLKKKGKKPFDLGCKEVRVEVVLEDMGVKKNSPRTWVVRKYSSTRPWTKLWRKCLQTRGSCWGRSIEFKLVAKAWAHKKISPTSFPNHMLESA